MQIKFYHLLSVLIGLVSLSNVANAQSKIWEKVTIRKAFETKTEDDKKPAIFSLP